MFYILKELTSMMVITKLGELQTGQYIGQKVKLIVPVMTDRSARLSTPVSIIIKTRSAKTTQDNALRMFLRTII